MNKCLAFTLIILLLNGCGGMTLNTNFGSYVINKAQKSARASAVEEYSQTEILNFDASVIGFVNTDFCQDSRNKTLPSKKALKKSLKVETN